MARLCDYYFPDDAGKLGCESATYNGQSADLCVCDTDKCNGAVMTSSVGHVIITVTLFINVVVGYLLWTAQSAAEADEDDHNRLNVDDDFTYQ